MSGFVAVEDRLVGQCLLEFLIRRGDRRTGLAAAQGKQTFTGIITDNMCGQSHAQIRMGPTDAECTIACIHSHGATYVLADGKNVYALSDQKTPEKFAAARVKIVGTLDAKTKTIQVESITAAK